MHEDYQLAYCLIAHITALAFVDDAFESTCLTPKVLHKLRGPPPYTPTLHVLSNVMNAKAVVLKLRCSAPSRGRHGVASCSSLISRAFPGL